MDTGQQPDYNVAPIVQYVSFSASAICQRPIQQEILANITTHLTYLKAMYSKTFTIAQKKESLANAR